MFEEWNILSKPIFVQDDNVSIYLDQNLFIISFSTKKYDKQNVVYHNFLGHLRCQLQFYNERIPT